MSYYIAKDGSLAVAQIPKSGLMSLKHWLHGFDVVSNTDSKLLECPKRIAFIRNPLSRLQSCYSFFNGMAKAGNPHHSGAPVKTWEEFVDYVLEGNDNEHWCPQFQQTGGLQHITHRLDDIEKVFFRYHSAPLIHTNRSKRIPVSNHRLDEIVSYYHKDFKAWLGATD